MRGLLGKGFVVAVMVLGEVSLCSFLFFFLFLCVFVWLGDNERKRGESFTDGVLWAFLCIISVGLYGFV